MSKGVAVRSHDGVSHWNVSSGTMLATLMQQASKRISSDADVANIIGLVLGYTNRLIAALLTAYRVSDEATMQALCASVQQNLELTSSQLEAKVTTL